MKLAQTERAALCALLEARGPAAPTLCEGWNTADLAAHLWVRESDPLAAPGIVLRPLATLTDKRMADVLERWPYEVLVRHLAQGPSAFSVFSLPGVDEAGNALEYFVHHEDVRRAGPEADLAPRELGADVEDLLWRRLKLMARPMFRRAPVGVVLEREGSGEEIRALPGAATVTLIGKPSELVLFAYGRGDVAAVRAIGDADAVAELRDADFSL